MNLSQYNIFIDILNSLKVVTNEKQRGTGSWQMTDIGPGPW
jgi:hypothetical protein